MKDITLLERAAKAVGLPVSRVKDELFWETEDSEGVVRIEWNPLKDDGDAFRLLVLLGDVVNVDPGEENVNARARRAIVMAAANKGRKDGS